MPSLRHFLLTRFYIKNPGCGYDGTQDLEWLEGRFALFETICYPSVMQQTNQNFMWFLACHEDVPEAYRKRLAAYEGPRVKVTYQNRSFAGVEEQLREERSLRLRKTRYLISSRLDSDDALCPHYIERVQGALEHFRSLGTPTMVHNFRNGYGLDLSSGHLYAESSQNRQYVSLFVDLQQRSPLSVYHRDHGKIHLDHPFFLDDHAGWMTVVHGGNVTNSIHGTRLDRVVVATATEEGRPQILWDRVWDCCQRQVFGVGPV